MFLDGIPETVEMSDFEWWIPDWYIDEYMKLFEEWTCMTQTVASIKGTEKIIVPEFEIDNKYLDDFNLEPFPFQKVGISFLREIKSGILGDSMGLGKTPSSIGASHQLIKENIIKNILVIVPASLKYQWQEELKKFVNYDSIVIDGTKKKREKQAKEFMDNPDIHYLIVGYESFRNDWETILKIDFECTIVDEAHRLKNRDTKLFKSIENIDTEYKFALTGTPVQNKPQEIFALMSWLQPDVLGNITNFRKKHIIYGDKFNRRFVELGYKHLDEIREKTSPYILRRLKLDVAPDLPKIINTVRWTELNKPQRELYDLIESDKKLIELQIEEQNREIERLSTSSEDKKRRIKEASKEEGFVSDNVLLGYNYMQEAVADYPLLLLIGNSKMAKKYTPFIKKCKTSPKLEELITICQELRDNGSKIIIFTKYARMLEIISKRIETVFEEIPYLIHGAIPTRDRQQAVTMFTSSESKSNFMVLTDAGNYGLIFGPCTVNCGNILRA